MLAPATPPPPPSLYDEYTHTCALYSYITVQEYLTIYLTRNTEVTNS